MVVCKKPDQALSQKERNALVLSLLNQGRDKPEWQRLDLSGWGLTELSPEIGRLTQLKELYLGDNQLI